MSDEAVIRIKFEGGGGPSKGTAAAKTPGAPGSSAPVILQVRAVEILGPFPLPVTVVSSRHDVVPAGGGGRSTATAGADSLVDVLDKFRGSIGAAFGPLAGAIVDLISAFRSLQTTAAVKGAADFIRPGAGGLGAYAGSFKTTGAIHPGSGGGYKGSFPDSGPTGGGRPAGDVRGEAPPRPTPDWRDWRSPSDWHRKQKDIPKDRWRNFSGMPPGAMGFGPTGGILDEDLPGMTAGEYREHRKRRKKEQVKEYPVAPDNPVVILPSGEHVLKDSPADPTSPYYPYPPDFKPLHATKVEKPTGADARGIVPYEGPPAGASGLPGGLVPTASHPGAREVPPAGGGLGPPAPPQVVHPYPYEPPQPPGPPPRRIYPWNGGPPGGAGTPPPGYPPTGGGGRSPPRGNLPPPGANFTAGGGGGGGIGAAIGAAAGPIAIAFAALAAMKAFKDVLTGAIKGVGDFGAAMISPSNDPGQFIDSMGGAVKGFSDKLFYVSPVLGIFGSVLGESVMVVSRFMKALDGLVDRYGDYNPALAQAQAMADVTQVLGDLRRAQTAGPVLAQYVQARTEMQQKFEDAKIRMLQKMLPAILTAMKYVEQLAPVAEMAVDVFMKVAESMPIVGADIKAMRDRLDEASRAAITHDPTDTIMEGFLEPGTTHGPRGHLGVEVPGV